ncbi:uncharacterized protein LOC123200081 [Mangifera indica]|uniref:uncharacterized protein LOC123200081 n=1 Tax=Mangifera indica TaxID=29780 RepID=UPI001CFBCCDC|nr:uncharacterized protein LOC123200081 [Mangifera indica]
MVAPAFSFSSLPLFVPLFLCFFLAHHVTPFKGVDMGNPAVDVTPYPLADVPGSKDVISCERVQVSGYSRLKLGSYANSFRVTLAPSVVIPERLHSKIQVCFHRNISLALCQCEKDEWKAIQKGGVWSSVMSPYEERYIDVKFVGGVSGSVSVAVEEDFQRWRLLCLAVGFVLLLLAPVVSHWVPFYYSSSMAIGVFLVIIILLFQGMKLLPTGRKNVLYLTIYGSVLGAGSFLLHQFSVLVNSILVSFGLSEEMHNPVSIFLLVGIVLAGAALGYWIVRKFVISKDGTVDVGVAQFVKWAMRIIATTSIFQSTLDTPLALGALVSCCTVCCLITSSKWLGSGLHQSRQSTRKHGHAEFLSRSPVAVSRRNLWNSSSPMISPSWSNSPVNGVISPYAGEGIINQQNYYSAFHKIKKRKFTKQEWEDFTRESTRQAVAELTASPEFTDWIIDHADRIKLLPSDSSDESVGSETDSTDENAAGRSNGFRLFGW